jgi:rod shape-determining protein MreC
MAMNRKKRGLLFWLLIGLVIVIVVRIWYTRKPGMLEKYSSYAVYPFFALHRVLVDPIVQSMARHRTVSELEKSLAQLQAERDELMAESIELRSELRYNADIKELKEADKSYADAVLCTAQVIAKNFSKDSHYMLIDAGISKGVEKDMVVVYKKCLIGKVSEVYPWYSKVILITDRTCKVAVQCANQKTTGIHEGKNDIGSTQLDYVSHLEPIEIGDYLISSGEGLVFPRGLGVGQIISCTQSGLYHVVEVKPLLDLQKIIYCSIIQRGKMDLLNTSTSGS